MVEIAKILCPVDFSDNSQLARCVRYQLLVVRLHPVLLKVLMAHFER